MKDKCTKPIALGMMWKGRETSRSAELSMAESERVKIKDSWVNTFSTFSSKKTRLVY